MKTNTQQQVLQCFTNGIQNDKVSHATLLVCSDFLLLEKLAYKIAAMLLCNATKNHPCNNCNACLKVSEKIHSDVFWISPQDKKNISIAKIREISEEATTKPWEADCKIFILQSAERIGIEAANALLKILEEPPGYTVFLLLTANLHTIPETIISRCQIFSIGNMGVATCSETLIQEHNIPQHRAIVASRLGDGNIDSALSILEQYWEVRERLMDLILQTKDPIELGESLAQACGSGEEGRQKAITILTYLSSVIRDILLAQQGLLSVQVTINSDYLNEIRKCAQRYTERQMAHFLDKTIEAQKMVRSNVTLGILWENICMYPAVI